MTRDRDVLQPCPWCGNDAPTLETDGSVMWRDCGACDSQGPGGLNQYEADYLWNRRTPSPSGPADPQRPHLVDGEFQSDKYPTCPAGKVPLSTKDPSAQDLLWAYAQRRRAVDAEFADDLEEALRLKGYEAPEADRDRLALLENLVQVCMDWRCAENLDDSEIPDRVCDVLDQMQTKVAMTAPKLCRDCRWCEIKEQSSAHGHFLTQCAEPSHGGFLSTPFARSPKGLCGPEGRLWEGK